MWLQGRRPLCDQWEPFSARQLRKWWKNSDRSTTRGHSPKSLERSDSVPKVTGQDFTSAISHVPAFKMQTNSNPKSDVMFTVSTSYSQAHYSPFMFFSFQACIHCCWTSIKQGEITFMDRESPPHHHVDFLRLPTCISHQHGTSLGLNSSLIWTDALFMHYWQKLLSCIGIWPFESIRVKMVLMSSHQSSTFQEKDSSREDNSHAGNLKAFFE